MVESHRDETTQVQRGAAVLQLVIVLRNPAVADVAIVAGKPGDRAFHHGTVHHAGLIQQSPSDGLRFAIFYTKVHDRLLRPLFATDQPPASPPIRKALHTNNIHITETINQAGLLPKTA